MPTTFSSTHANTIIGASRDTYKCNHVVNYVLNNGNAQGLLAREYLNWGHRVFVPAAGVVVVGTDGVHVGIFISPTEFIHSSASRNTVVRAPLSQLRYVFPAGYVFRAQ